MTDGGRLRRLRELFDAVVDLPAPERHAALERLAGADEALRREVLALVDEAERTSPGLRSGDAAPADPAGPAAGLVGQRLGPYDIVRLVGLGGMGAVYEAARDEEGVRRTVAVKLVRLDLNEPAVFARFRREHRILARLKHRNIATLLDAGIAPDGRPFLVMEYVEGEPITAWCDRRGLGVAQRLALFRQVCAAVQHAHRNLVVHRDLKPGNILVTAEGDVKLLDFGVAQLLDAQADSELPLTRGGGPRPYTPEYASPEQIRGDALTTASDVWSLGVVLFELLAGHRPFEAARSRTALERAVLDGPVPRPSQAVDDEAARSRGERDAARLRRRLAGELDNIVLLALRPEPESRWPSVEALADDVRCWLEGRPVTAQRGWVGYRLRKFLRRNRAATAATVLLVLALAAGAVTTGVQARHARRAQLRAEKVSGFLADLVQSVQPEGGRRDVMVSEVLDAAAQRLSASAIDEPGVRTELERVIGQSELALGRLEQAEKHLLEAAARQEQLTGRRSSQYVNALTYVADVYLAGGSLDRADSVIGVGLDLARALSAEPDTLYASLLSMRGSIANNRGDPVAAERAHREVMEIRERLLNPRSDLFITTYNNLAVSLGTQGRWAAAESLQRRAVAIARANHPAPSVQVANTENSLATALDLQGKLDEADSLYADVLEQRGRLLGREHPDYASTLANYAGFVFERGRYDRAAGLCRELLALRGGALPESHPSIASALQTLGRCLDRQGLAAEAGRAFTESLDLRRRYLGDDSWLVGSSTGMLGEHVTATGDYPRAERLLLEADRILTAALGPDHARTRQNTGRLVRLYEAWGRPDEAARWSARLPASAP